MKLTAEFYREVRAKLAALGYVEDWEWAQNVRAPETPEALACEYTWVVVNSGMHHRAARAIMDRVWPRLVAGLPIYPAAFGHAGKALAIGVMWDQRERRLAAFRELGGEVERVLAWCESLPWIGAITKYHLAKNLGADVAKPDRWLVRLAAAEVTTVDELCRRLAAETGDRVATVDVVLWRACAVGVLVVDERGVRPA